VLVSIGYKGVPLPGIEQYFDEGRGVVVNEHGRIEGVSSQLGGLYTSGWLKRGPSGIIGTNIADAKDTVTSIVKDLESSESESRRPSGDIQSLLEERSVDVVRWDGYMRIEDEERNRRRSESQPREKITDINDMLKTANNAK
jgi:NADPH-dependent glutamate synthase beta subunit-like oxidoreductase